jgi:trehalose-6-phosphate synthase
VTDRADVAEGLKQRLLAWEQALPEAKRETVLPLPVPSGAPEAAAAPEASGAPEAAP